MIDSRSEYFTPGSEIPIVTTCSPSKPRSIDCSRWSVRTSSTSADEQNHRRRQLGRDEHSARPRSRRASRRAAAAVAQQSSPSPPRVVEMAGNTPNATPLNIAISVAKNRYGRLDMHRHARRQRARIERNQRGRGQQSCRRARESTEQGKYHALRQRLTNEPAPTRAQRRAHGDLAPSGLRARQREVRDVRARDEQNERRRSGQGQQRWSNVRRPPRRAASGPRRVPVLTPDSPARAR